MKRLILFTVFLLTVSLCFLFSGCISGKVKLTTEMGKYIGDSFQAAVASGELNAEESIKAWPWAAGIIEGLMADEYEYNLTPLISNIITKLDALAEKVDKGEKLTLREKSIILGCFVRLEREFIKNGLEKYGISFTGLIRTFMGGG